MAEFRSRWGFHPCDYETFRLLKQLNRLCEKAQRLHAQWQRWRRKKPHNRLLRRKVRDAEGRVVGREVVGPWPEPPLCPLFCAREQTVSHFDEDGRILREGRRAERVVFHDHGIPAAYRAARRPAPAADQVVPLPLSAEDVRRLAAQAKALEGKK
jgi:hypothetical protein